MKLVNKAQLFLIGSLIASVTSTAPVNAVPPGSMCDIVDLVNGSEPIIHPPGGIIDHLDKRCWNTNGNHQHRTNINPFSYGTADGQYDADRVWVNETFTNVGDGKMSHGYINETAWSAPDYFFSNRWANWPDSLKKIINTAFTDWSDIKSDKKHLNTGILFNNFDTSEFVDDPTLGRDRFEIRISRGNPSNYIGLLTGPSEVFRIDDGPIEMVFRDDSSGEGRHPVNGWPIRWDYTEQWYYGDGDRDVFLKSKKSDDFYTVALHEIGHLIGLTHQSDDDDILYILAGQLDSMKERPNMAYRKLSEDDTNGARDLYSVMLPDCPSSDDKVKQSTLEKTGFRCIIGDKMFSDFHFDRATTGSYWFTSNSPYEYSFNGSSVSLETGTGILSYGYSVAINMADNKISGYSTNITGSTEKSLVGTSGSTIYANTNNTYLYGDAFDGPIAFMGTADVSFNSNLTFSDTIYQTPAPHALAGLGSIFVFSRKLRARISSCQRKASSGQLF